jgi:periplasmic protein TonB
MQASNYKNHFSNTKIKIMNIKKSKRANIENRRTVFFQVGLGLVLVSVLAAFEWATPTGNTKTDFTNVTPISQDIYIPPTEHKKLKQPEPLKPPVEFKKVSEDEEFVEEDFYLDVSDPSFNPYSLSELEPEVEKPEIIDFYSVQEKPRFRGGEMNSFAKYVGSKIVFPDEAIQMGISGTIKITFVIDEQGKVTNARVTRSVDPMLDEIVLNAIRNSKGWEPGIQNGQKVKVQLTMPITFKLN